MHPIWLVIFALGGSEHADRHQCFLGLAFVVFAVGFRVLLGNVDEFLLVVFFCVALAFGLAAALAAGLVELLALALVVPFSLGFLLLAFSTSSSAFALDLALDLFRLDGSPATFAAIGTMATFSLG
jgi:hypothetical protein